MESLSIWLKIKRAIEHLEALKDAIAQDVSSYGDNFIRKADGKETLDLLEPSPMISLLAGEFIYQLRSALDHTAFDLVQMNKGNIVLPTDWQEGCAFPIWCDSLKPGQKTPLPYGTFKKLPGIPVQAHTLIEKVQPYYPSGTGSINTSLGMLNKLSNIDKHRRFALTRTRAKVRHRVIFKSGFRGESINTLDHGAEIPPPYAGEDDPIVDVERSTTLTIAFDERDMLGDASGVPIGDLLEEIFSDVWGKVVDPLRRFMWP
jgi:hypothetical protein